MDVFKITNLKAAILFDGSSLVNGDNDSLIFFEYLFGLGTFMSNAKVSQAIICVPPTYTHQTPIGFDSSKFYFSEDTLENHMIALAKDRSIKLLVCFGNLEKLLSLCSELSFRNAIIITEDPIEHLRDSKIIHTYRILPARILRYLGKAFWWRVMPREFISYNWIQYSQVADKSINELELLAQVAISKSKPPVQFELRNRIIHLMNVLCKQQISNQMTQISCYCNDFRDQKLSNQQKTELFNIIVSLIGDLDAQFLRYSVKEMNTPRILELLVKFQTLLGMVQITYFNDAQTKVMNQICDENRRHKGQVPLRFDFTKYDYTCPIITRKKDQSTPCLKCGKLIKQGDSFCAFCGVKL